jgi:hypothetical protein
VETIEYLIERHKNKYRLFLDYCEEIGVNVKDFPQCEEISLKKMAAGSVGMSDNAATALATTSLLIERVRELVESDFTEDQLSAMTPEEKSRLFKYLALVASRIFAVY